MTLDELKKENELLKAQLIQCTKAMREVSESLERRAHCREQGLAVHFKLEMDRSLADKLNAARANPVVVLNETPRDWVADVLAFQRKFGKAVGEYNDPYVRRSGPESWWFRLKLLHEEYGELLLAAELSDVVGVADALADTIYVSIGTALAFGIDLRPVWEEVHRSNMAKEGGPTRADGKILKPEGWQPPDIAGALKKGAL